MVGIRCFEILGFDIMLDSNLKPWLIEVNHLPSFGTDSPLDLDIKARLMEQVFSTLAVRADDETAYSLYNHVEAEKRLHRTRAAPEAAAEKKVEKKVTEKPVEAPKPPPVIEEEEDLIDEEAQKEIEQQALLAEEQRRKNFEAGIIQSATEAAEKLKQDSILLGSGDGVVLAEVECSPDRMLVIQSILVGIYERYCPEKVNKVDRLLQKYICREEEFLQFVVQKYFIDLSFLTQLLINVAMVNIDELYLASKAADASAEQAAAAPAQGAASRGLSNGTRRRNPVSTVRSSSRGRSLSPPSGPTRRAPAHWRGGSEEDEAAYREEVIAAHVPKEDNEWLVYETKRLVQFTRCFPVLESPNKDDQDEAELEKEEEEEEEKEKDPPVTEGKEKSKGDAVVSKPEKKKVASFVDLMVQVSISYCTVF